MTKRLLETNCILKYISKHKDISLVKDGQLTVIVYANFYPIAYHDNKGNLKGSDVDIINNFSKMMKINVIYIESLKFDDIWLEVAKGNADIAIGGIGLLKNRLNPKIDWTIPYFNIERTIIYNKNNPIKKFPEDVNSIIVATPGSTGFQDSEIKMKLIGKTELLISSNNDKDDIERLLKGEIQGIMRGSISGKSIVKKYKKKLDMVEPWKIDKCLVTLHGEVFAFPTKVGSGLSNLLSIYITYILGNQLWNFKTKPEKIKRRKIN
jgi:ABC-type amino acid transport substrate-binding protein